MQVQLILVGLRTMQDFYAGTLHANSQPFTSWTETKAKDLRLEIMLLKLTAFSEIPRSHCVVQTSGPQFCTISRNVDATCTVSVPLELPDQGLIMEIPNSNVTITATAEATFESGLMARA